MTLREGIGGQWTKTTRCGIFSRLLGRLGAGDRNMARRVRDAEPQADLGHGLIGELIIERLQRFQLAQICIELFG